MQSTQSQIKSIATFMVACAIGAGAGTSAMVVNAAVQRTADAQDQTVVSSGPADPNAKVDPGAAKVDPVAKNHAARVRLDRTGRKQVGKASFYAERYSGRTMADGTPMRLYSNNAASLTLPLGSTAKVTNLQTGRSAIVTIRDRGPYVKGRIVDLSPATARQIGIERRQGLAKVELTPLSIPRADGTVWHAATASDPATLARNAGT
jgi:rare lipoprotein A